MTLAKGVSGRTFCYLEPSEHWTGARSLLRNPELRAAVDSHATRFRSTATGYIRYTLFSTRLPWTGAKARTQTWLLSGMVGSKRHVL